MTQTNTNLEGNVYVTKTGNIYNVSNMSKGFLKNQIEYIERTGFNIEKLGILKEALRIKSIIKFNFTA